MKSKLNLTIDNTLLKSTKIYAEKHQMSVSELTENFYKSITKPAKKETFIDMIERLDKPDVDSETNLKDLYYNDPKHGG